LVVGGLYGAIGKREMSGSEIAAARGGEAGDWRPRLVWLRVIRLLGPA
jgi:hypothetical protein